METEIQIPSFLRTPDYVSTNPTPRRSNSFAEKTPALESADAGYWDRRVRESINRAYPDRAAALKKFEAEERQKKLLAVSDAWKSSGYWVDGVESVHSQTARAGKYDPSNGEWNAEFDRLKKWEPGRIITFFGPVGVGKTQLATSLAWEWALQLDWTYKKSIRYVSTEELLKGVRSQIGERGEAAFLTPFNKATVLILDDEGLSPQTDHRVRTLFTLIDSRYRVRNGALVIISNRTPGEMQVTDTASFSRIRERNGVVDCAKWGAYR
jgi:predicted ATPase